MQFDNGMISRAGGLYWKLLTDGAKNHYKMLAEVKNYEERRNGRFKVRGFWVFAKELCRALKSGQGDPFYQQIAAMLSEEALETYERIYDPYHIWFIRDVHFDLIFNVQ